MSNKTCSNCGAPFTCDISKGEASCWCFDMPNIIPIETIDNDNSAEDCLCPDCLQAKIDALQQSAASTE